jgi:hypothetical protein
MSRQQAARHMFLGAWNGSSEKALARLSMHGARLLERHVVLAAACGCFLYSTLQHLLLLLLCVHACHTDAVWLLAAVGYAPLLLCCFCLAGKSAAHTRWKTAAACHLLHTAWTGMWLPSCAPANHKIDVSQSRTAIVQAVTLWFMQGATVALHTATAAVLLLGNGSCTLGAYSTLGTAMPILHSYLDHANLRLEVHCATKPIRKRGA